MQLNATIVFPGTTTEAPFAHIVEMTPTNGATNDVISFLGDDWHAETETAHFSANEAKNLIIRMTRGMSTGSAITDGADYALMEFVDFANDLLAPNAELYICAA